MKDADVDWSLVRRGSFHGNDRFRIRTKDPKQALALLVTLGGSDDDLAGWSWNEDAGDYVWVQQGHPAWATICKMKS
jgi:hypothetical protein